MANQMKPELRRQIERAGFRSPPPHKRSSGNTGQFKLQRGKPNKYTPHQGAKQRGP